MHPVNVTFSLTIEIYSDSIAIAPAVTSLRSSDPLFMGQTCFKVQLQVPLNASILAQFSRYLAIAQIRMDISSHSLSAQSVRYLGKNIYYGQQLERIPFMTDIAFTC